MSSYPRSARASSAHRAIARPRPAQAGYDSSQSLALVVPRLAAELTDTHPARLRQMILDRVVRTEHVRGRLHVELADVLAQTSGLVPEVEEGGRR
jgi:hypothetical protein